MKATADAPSVEEIQKSIAADEARVAELRAQLARAVELDRKLAEALVSGKSVKSIEAERDALNTRVIESAAQRLEARIADEKAKLSEAQERVRIEETRARARRLAEAAPDLRKRFRAAFEALAAVIEEMRLHTESVYAVARACPDAFSKAEMNPAFNRSLSPGELPGSAVTDLAEVLRECNHGGKAFETIRIRVK